MKQNDLVRRLKKAGCYLKRHGADHDIWHSPITGCDWPVSRHEAKEVPKGTIRRIYEKLLGK